MSSCPCCGKPLPDTAQEVELCSLCAEAMEKGTPVPDDLAKVQAAQLPRPAGVTVLAILFYSLGVFLVLDTVTPSPLQWPYARDEMTLVCLVGAALWCLAGWTFWRLLSWGRIMVIALSILDLVLGGNPSGAWFRILCVILIWYLLRPNVKASFGVMPEEVLSSSYFEPDPHQVET